MISRKHQPANPTVGGHRLRHVALTDIFIVSGPRDVSAGAVSELAESIRKLGLQEPIKVRYNETYIDPVEGEIGGALTLIAGGHRLAACRSLGWEEIPAFVLTVGDVDARLIEIAENLHRNELSELERREQVDEWIKLTEGSIAISAQHEPKSAGRPKSGINAAVEVLNIDRNDGQRSAKIAALSEDAKDAARSSKHSLDDNQAALLEAAKAPRERQAEVIREIDNAGSVAAYRASQDDGDIKKRAALEAANLIAEYVPAKFWGGLKANLFACGAKGVAAELTNIIGQSTGYDRRGSFH